MMSLSVVWPRRAAQLRSEDWEPWKTLIRTKYLIDNMEVDAIVIELKDYGFEITQVYFSWNGTWSI